MAAAGVGAIIVAAGRGLRMGGVDKLFVPLCGRPLLAHTLAPFQACQRVDRIVLVLAPENQERGRQLVIDHGFHKVAAICPGGPRRQDSVRLGLEALGEAQWVLVHDGARPLLSGELIEQTLEAARETGAAVPALPLVDTIKQAGSDGSVVRTLDRSGLWTVQTPQAFRYDLLRRAHDQLTADVTDDSTLVEALGITVRLLAGSRLNLKVTTAEDLRVVEGILALRPVPEAPEPAVRSTCESA